MAISAEGQRILAAFEAAKVDRVDRNAGEKFEAQKELEKQRAIETLRNSAFTSRQINAFNNNFGNDTRTSLQKARDNLADINARKALASQSANDNGNAGRIIIVNLQESIGINDEIIVDEADEAGFDFGTAASQTLNNLQIAEIRKAKDELFRRALINGAYRELTTSENNFINSFKDEPPQRIFKSFRIFKIGSQGFRIRSSENRLVNRDEINKWNEDKKKFDILVSIRSGFDLINNERQRINQKLQLFITTGIKSTAQKLDLQKTINEASAFLENVIINDVDINKQLIKNLRVSILDALQVSKTGITKTISTQKDVSETTRVGKPSNVFNTFEIDLASTLGSRLGTDQIGGDRFSRSIQKAFNPNEDEMTELIVNANRAQRRAAKILETENQ